MIIYLHDSRSPYKKNQSFKAHKSASDVEHVPITTMMTMDQVAKAVIKKAGKPRNIWLLVMLAHGNKGWLQMGTGLTSSTANKFSQLKTYMTPGGKGIEIHGCAVASDTKVAYYPYLDQETKSKHLRGTARSSATAGVNMLKALAKAAGCIVKGAIDAQRSNTIKYNGHYVVVQPNGHFDFHKGDTGKINWK